MIYHNIFAINLRKSEIINCVFSVVIAKNIYSRLIVIYTSFYVIFIGFRHRGSEVRVLNFFF